MQLCIAEYNDDIAKLRENPELVKENMKKKPKSAQKIHFLFTIIAAKTVKTHKKIEKHT